MSLFDKGSPEYIAARQRMERSIRKERDEEYYIHTRRMFAEMEKRGREGTIGQPRNLASGGIINPPGLNSNSPISGVDLHRLKLVAQPYFLTIENDEARAWYIFRLHVPRLYKVEFAELKVDHEQIHTAFDPMSLAIYTINKLKQDMEKGEENVNQGDYPDVREWAANHLHIKPPLDPYKPIPGWVFPKWNNAHPGMRALKNGGVESKGTIVSAARAGNKTIPAPKKIIKAPLPRDLSKVKKPTCPIHKGKMEFDAIRSVWECTSPGCTLIARPKNEPGIGTVTLGKGNVTLRIICQEGEQPAYILISDDNIALDITNLVNVKDVDAAFEITDVVNHSNISNISIPAQSAIEIWAKASIVNADFYPRQG